MIELRGLGKTYRAPTTLGDLLHGRLRGAPVVALDDVCLSIERGAIVGLMGANGAGKSTLLRILGGLLLPDRGELIWEGRVASGDAALRRRVGLVMGDERSFSLRLSARENLALIGALHGLRRRPALARADELLARVGLRQVAERRFFTLSTGMRQRLALARGLIAQPDVLLLDEPLRGIDPAGRASLRALILDEARGRTVLWATHDVSELAESCPRVVLLAAGRVRAVVDPKEALRALTEEEHARA